MGDTRRLNKKKTTSIGNSNQSVYVNDIGNAYLHKQHEVAIRHLEGNKIGTAIVFDQHIIDKLYTHNLLDENQHNVCDKYLALIVKSGAFTAAPAEMEKIFTGNGFCSFSTKACVLQGVQEKIVAICGRDKEKTFWKIMTVNPTKINESQSNTVRECADALLKFWYTNQTSPVSLFQKAFVVQS